MSSQMETVRDILLAHKGKKNRITSAQVAARVGIDEDATHAKTRALILAVAEKYKIALAADTRGYYVITSDAEYRDYMREKILSREIIKEVPYDFYHKKQGIGGA